MSSVLGSTPGIIVGVGVGGAASAALEPAFEVPRQEAWRKNPNRIIDVNLVARLVAQGGIPLDANAIDHAMRDGFSEDSLRSLVYLAQTVPGFSEARELWRRGHIGQGLVEHALTKEGRDPRYFPDVGKFKLDEPLSPQEVALGVVRSILPDDGLLTRSLDFTPGRVPAYQVSPIDPVLEAEQSGIDREHLRVMVGSIGLPMSAQQAASALFRGIIEHGDYNRAIAEGDTRPEWAPYILDQAREIPTVRDFVQYRLRGWTDDTGLHDGAARHGMAKADADLLLKVSGRPLSWHQVFIGLRRGGIYDGPTDHIHPAFLKSLQESDIRPEWYNIAWAQRFNYPTAFVLRSLTENGDISGQEAEDILLFEGWEPTLAHKVATKWAGGAGASTDANVKKAQSKAWTEAQSSYVARESTAADVQPIFDLLGMDSAAQTEALAAWDAVRELTRKQLSPKQITTAVNDGITNPATGAPWTPADAVAALVARGYTQADATTIVQEG